MGKILSPAVKREDLVYFHFTLGRMALKCVETVKCVESKVDQAASSPENFYFYGMASMLDLITPLPPAAPPVPMERPRICGIDLTKEVSQRLKSNGYLLVEGSFGSTLKIHLSSRDQSVALLPDHHFPENFHEFDIVILDLCNAPEKPFRTVDHLNLDTRQQRVTKLVCRFPTTIFDPRPLSSAFLAEQKQGIQDRPFIQIVFACGDYSVDYLPLIITDKHSEFSDKVTRSIYDFWGDIPLLHPRKGRELSVCVSDPTLMSLVGKYKKDFDYHQTFSHPTKWITPTRAVNDPNFIPILQNINGEIVGFSWKQGHVLSFVFPNIDKKPDFLSEFLQVIATVAMPELFPHSSQFKWIEDPKYQVGQHHLLLKEKEVAQQLFETTIAAIDARIAQNNSRWGFLHEQLTGTGDELVLAVSKYLVWLGFDRVNIKAERVNGGLRRGHRN